MGNQHDTVPRRLLQDPLLSPRDKFAWQVIRMQAQDNGGAVFPSYSELQVQFSNRPLDEKASRSTVRTCSMMRPGASLAAACKTRSPICWRRCAKRRTASLISIDGINLRCRNLCHLWFQIRKYRQGRVKSGISVSWLRRFGRSIWGVADASCIEYGYGVPNSHKKRTAY